MDRTVVLRFDARVLVVIGVLLVMLAAWLPWANLPAFVVGDLARRGVDGGGLITFGLALLAVLSLLLPWHPLRRVSLAATILAVFINLVVLIAFARVMQLSGSLGIVLGAQLGSVGSGLYLTLAGAVLMLFGGLTDATSPSLFEMESTDLVSPRQIEVALRVALAGLLLASCLCAWGIGLLVRPYALSNPGQAQAAATFGPAPTTFLATPLVDVRLAPLSTVSGGVPVTPVTPTRPGIVLLATPTSAPVGAASSTLPTPRRAQPTSPPTSTLLSEPTRALPTISAPTQTPPASPTQTPPTSPTQTPPASPTQTPPASPLKTPTATGTITGTLTPVSP